MRNNWSNLVTHAAVGSIGFVLAKYVGNVAYFQVDRQIDLVAVVALLLTITLSVVFYRKFEKVKYSDQLKKNATLERLSSSMDSLTQLEDLCTANEPFYSEVVKLCRKCRRDFEAYVSFANALSVPLLDGNDTKFKLICSDLRNNLTDLPPRSDPNPKLKVAKNVLRIAPDRLVEVENQIDEGKRLLFEMQKDIILDLA
jgi:hypothetical protein